MSADTCMLAPRLSTSLLATSLASLMRMPLRASPLRAACVSVSSTFDAGNIELVAAEASTVRLRIRPDPHTELEKKQHMQWFAFRATPAAIDSGEVTYEIENAGACSFPTAWPGSAVVASTDRKEWRRVHSTQYDAARGALTWRWSHTPNEAVYFAYFDLYSHERALDLVARAATAGGRARSLGQTLQGRELDVVTVGRGPLVAWIIARQHPGESQAAFFAEGLLSRLLGLESGGAVDGLTASLLGRYTFHVVPCMNPDGATAGYLRVNAVGANLNREWAPTGEYDAPTLERSPEVWHALAAMDAEPPDVFVDVHGDEALPFAFLAGSEGVPAWGPRLRDLHGAFVGAYSRANPDMQARFGYEPDAPSGGNPAICSNQVAIRYDCLSATLEMPFKDNVANGGAIEAGLAYDGRRCAALGASLLDALAHVAPQLRGVDEPVFPLADDAYVAPVEDEAAVDAFIEAQRQGDCPKAA